MNKYIKKILAFSIVFSGCVFLKIGGNSSISLIIIGSLGMLIIALPAYLWYRDNLK